MSPMTRFARLASALGLSVAFAACADDGTGPLDEVEFPVLDAAVLAEFCIRGQMVPVDAADESLQATDCATVFPVGVGPGLVYETWRVRVASTTEVTIFTESNIDTFLDVFEINPAAPILDLVNLVEFNDDRSETDFNASVSPTLQPGIEYWVMVSGFDADELGPYTLRVTE